VVRKRKVMPFPVMDTLYWFRVGSDGEQIKWCDRMIVAEWVGIVVMP
jgi:hypothetical protein